MLEKQDIYTKGLLRWVCC